MAKRSADYANAAIAAAEKEARISLRAWVVPAKTQFTQLEIGNVIRIEIQAVNNGRTPAINATTDFQSEVFLKGLPRPIIKPFPVEPEPLGKATVRSGGTILISLDLFLLTDEKLKQIDSGQLIIRVHGKTWYEDVFNHRHWMTICREYDESSKGFTPCDVEGEQIDSDPE